MVDWLVGWLVGWLAGWLAGLFTHLFESVIMVASACRSDSTNKKSIRFLGFKLDMSGFSNSHLDMNNIFFLQHSEHMLHCGQQKLSTRLYSTRTICTFSSPKSFFGARNVFFLICYFSKTFVLNSLLPTSFFSSKSVCPKSFFSKIVSSKIFSKNVLPTTLFYQVVSFPQKHRASTVDKFLKCVFCRCHYCYLSFSYKTTFTACAYHFVFSALPLWW